MTAFPRACAFSKYPRARGFPINADSEAHLYSARAPRHVPKTGSPGVNRVTFLPTISTWSATS
jgi:hypothetical protein